VFATPSGLARLFGLDAPEVAASLARLARAGRVQLDCAVAGWSGRWAIARQ
jgi:hypothetical protein